MYDFNKTSLERRVKEKKEDGWEVKGEIFQKKVNFRAAITYGVRIVKKEG